MSWEIFLYLVLIEIFESLQHAKLSSSTGMEAFEIANLKDIEKKQRRRKYPKAIDMR